MGSDRTVVGEDWLEKHFRDIARENNLNVPHSILDPKDSPKLPEAMFETSGGRLIFAEVKNRLQINYELDVLGKFESIVNLVKATMGDHLIERFDWYVDFKNTSLGANYSVDSGGILRHFDEAATVKGAAGVKIYVHFRDLDAK